MKLLLRVLVLVGLLASAWSWAAPCPPKAEAASPERIQAAMRSAVDRGFLWRAEKDGRNLYLYGTLHLARFDWMFPGPAVQRALMASDTVALELDMLDAAIQQRLAAVMNDSALAPTDAPIEELATRLRRQASIACIDEAVLARMNPLFQVMTLSLLAARNDGLDPAYGIDVFLAGFARGAGKAVLSLEAPESQMSAVLGGDVAAQQAMLRQGLDDLEAQRTAPRLLRIATVWAEADHARLTTYPQWCECLDTESDRALMQRLLDARNPALAERIADLHAQGKRVFAAVGSLHMVGPLSITALLRERGFRVERVEFAR